MGLVPWSWSAEHDTRNILRDLPPLDNFLKEILEVQPVLLIVQSLDESVFHVVNRALLGERKRNRREILEGLLFGIDENNRLGNGIFCLGDIARNPVLASLATHHQELDKHEVGDIPEENEDEQELQGTACLNAHGIKALSRLGREYRINAQRDRMERSHVSLNIVDGSVKLEVCRRKRRVSIDNLVPVFCIEHRCVENAFEVIPELPLDCRLLYIQRNKRNHRSAFRIHDTGGCACPVDLVFQQPLD